MRITSALKYSFKVKPVFSTAIFLLLVLQMALECTNIVSLVPLFDMMLHPEKTNAVTEAVTKVLSYIGIAPSLPAFIVLVGITTTVKFISQFIIYALLSKYQRSMDIHLSVGLYEKLFFSNWAYFANHKVGSLVEMIQKCHVGGSAFLHAVKICNNALCVGVFILVPLTISIKITLGCIVLGGLLVAPLFLTGRSVRRIAKTKELIQSDWAQHLVESFAAAKMVFAYASNKPTIKKFDDFANRHRSKLFQQDIWSGGTSLLSEPLVILFVLLIIYVVFYRIGMDLGLMVVIIYSLQKLMLYSHRCVETYNQYQAVAPALEMVVAESTKAQSAYESNGNLECAGLKEGIGFADVEFAYVTGHTILNAVNLEIRKGEMTAFVGASGEGKTTILDLIIGLYKPDRGRILIDGIDLQDYDVKSWRNKLGYILQESILFNDTIRENILWPNTITASEHEIVEAAKLANAHDFIQGCSDGYETVVGDRGVRLSEGQRQRIALARAIVKKPEILILDEATSALDSESESMIQESLDQLAREITVIVVAHRLSTIRSASKIYVLENGQVSGAGTFEELQKENVIFQRFTDLQGMRN